MRSAIMQTRHAFSRQYGAGLIGTLLILSAFGILGMVGLKAIPAYMEYFTIQSTVHRIGNDPGMQTDEQRRKAFDHQSQIDRIESVTSRDLVMSGNEISVTYEKKIPLFEHATLLLTFDVSSLK